MTEITERKIGAFTLTLRKQPVIETSLEPVEELIVDDQDNQSEQAKEVANPTDDALGVLETQEEAQLTLMNHQQERNRKLKTWFAIVLANICETLYHMFCVWRTRVPEALQVDMENALEHAALRNPLDLMQKQSDGTFIIPKGRVARLSVATKIARDIRNIELDLRHRTKSIEGAVRIHVVRKLKELNIRKCDHHLIFNQAFEMCFIPTDGEIESQKMRATRSAVLKAEANRNSYYSRTERGWWYGRYLRPDPTSSS